MEVAPSPLNIMLPTETTEYFIALPSGGFKVCSKDWSPKSRAMRSIVKKPRRWHGKWQRWTCRNYVSNGPEVIPEKQVRVESHPLLGQRVLVVWDETVGPRLLLRHRGQVRFDAQGRPILRQV